MAKAYAGLSVIRSKEENLIQAIHETTDILTTFPDNLTSSAEAVIKNNLGTYYGELSEYQDKEKNLQIAISYLEQASNYYKTDSSKQKENFETKFNLAHLLMLLSASSKDIKQLHRAIDHYNLLLSGIEKINNRSSYYSVVNDALGTAYVELALLNQQNIETTIKKALHALQESLKYTSRERKTEIARIKQNQARAYIELSKINDPENNIVIAINLLNDALRTYTITEYPYLHAHTQITKCVAINNIIDLIPDISSKMRLLNYAHVSLCDVKSIFTLDKFPEQNKKIESLIPIINTKIIFPLIPYSKRTS